MADLIIGPLIEILADKLASPILQKFQDRYNLKDNIRKLHHSLPRIQALLEDAQKQQETCHAVKQWLEELEDAAFEAEVLLDELAAETKERERRSTKGKEVANFFQFKPTDYLFELASHLQKKLKELDHIVEQAFTFNLQQHDLGKMLGSSGRCRETMSVAGDNVYGREEDKQNIINLLLDDNSEEKKIIFPSVISVVGIGGIGKTMLAQLVYNDEMVSRHFELKMWVHVPKDFDLGNLMKRVIHSVTRKIYELCELDNLQAQLAELLKGRRFLLVLDDVWDEDEEKWHAFLNLFKVGGEGSRVLITTRSQGIRASTMYELKGLSYEECWNLFKEMAFGEGGDMRLIGIGKEIVKKCGGVPLAVRAMARLLRSKKEEYWMSVQDSELWQLKAYQSEVMPALKLSYQYLPSHLKRCLAFCSLFPKGHEIPREKMICIWMAHGLILPDGGTRQLEDIGGEYFDDLLSLSFFQQSEDVYTIHDLIHDLVRTVAGCGFSVLGQGLVAAPNDLERTRHLSMVCSFDNSSLPEALFGAKHLRTLLLSSGGSSDELTPFWPVNFIYLKALDLSGYGLKSLDEKTLNLFKCGDLVELPFEIAKLTSLRHLNIKGCEALTHMPAKVGELLHLQTLPIYIVGRRPGDSIAQLEFLDLRNELSIKSMENIRDSEEARKANMGEKKYLKSLKLQWGSGNGSKDNSSNPSHSFQPREDGDDVETILKHLEPHPHLKDLHVKGYPGRTFPDWNLPNLTMVELINCRRCENLPNFGHLPFLETLHLQGMNSITHITEAFYGGVAEPFPSLKHLTVRDFPYLEEWSSISNGAPFPRLEELVLDRCPNLTVAPTFPSIRRLELHHCDAKIISSIETTAALSSLVINQLPNLERLPGTFLGNKYSLESLEIRSCQNLLSLPPELEYLTALKSLIISCCLWSCSRSMTATG
ncbi:putative disease resistance protein RGA3 isoform X2 [Salvia miltiorrhiza]|uniref:putative disease resistance protein RGA3 isoform X2 n=1 Tax=Salvia miltiorrhiza TaxID=226208 RepID=UPI0025ACD7B4|nr:putative disease resistance protein RGA3 isoform X2 [Salvia miltiorrhiza]